MDTQDLFSACPVETTLKLIGDKWNVLILRDLFLGARRFSEMKRSLAGVSQKVLTSQLRGMEKAGLVDRAVYPEAPPRVEYSLTARGRSLRPVIESVWNWGRAFKEDLGLDVAAIPERMPVPAEPRER